MPTSVTKTVREIDFAAARDRRLIALFSTGGDEMESSPDKLAALVDVVRALDSIGAAHALIGGVAVGIHARTPRATLDTDLAVVSTIDRERLVEALEKAGFRCTGRFPHSVNFRHASGEPVQIAFDVEFDPMIERAERVRVGDAAIAVVRKEDLVTMKERAAADPNRRASKALRDRADIELLCGDVPDPDEGW